MGRKKESSFVDERTVELAEKDLEVLPNGAVAMRLLAVIAAGRGLGLEEIAEFLHTTRQSVAKWIGNYKRAGLKGLRDKPKGHRKKKMTSEQEEQVQDWLDQGKSPSGEPCHWTVDKVKSALENDKLVDAVNMEFGRMEKHGWPHKEPPENP